MVEKRRYKRAPTNLDVLINGSMLAKGTNVSLGGMYLHTGRSFALDSQLTLKFSITLKEMTVTARVMNCQPSIGMGVSFVGLTYDETHTLKRFVDESLQGQETTDQKKVLLVDDNDAQRRINKSRLVHDGFTVFEAGGGAEALGVLSKTPPDIAVLDLQMEDMDGFKVLAYIRGNDALKAMPVLILSSRGIQSEIDRAKSAGADGFLVKMMTSPAKLSEQVKKLLAK